MRPVYVRENLLTELAACYRRDDVGIVPYAEYGVRRMISGGLVCVLRAGRDDLFSIYTQILFFACYN